MVASAGSLKLLETSFASLKEIKRCVFKVGVGLGRSILVDITFVIWNDGHGKTGFDFGHCLGFVTIGRERKNNNGLSQRL